MSEFRESCRSLCPWCRQNLKQHHTRFVFLLLSLLVFLSAAHAHERAVNKDDLLVQQGNRQSSSSTQGDTTRLDSRVWRYLESEVELDVGEEGWWGRDWHAHGLLTGPRSTTSVSSQSIIHSHNQNQQYHDHFQHPHQDYYQPSLSHSPLTATYYSSDNPKSDTDTIEFQYLCSNMNNQELVPLPGCQEYIYCVDEMPVNRQSCPTGTLFDITILGCNHAYLVTCSVATHASTSSSSSSTTTTSSTTTSTTSTTSTLTQSTTTYPRKPQPSAPRPTAPSSLSSSDIDTLCESPQTEIVALPGCKGYLYCATRFVQLCPSGTLFDSTFLGCNHEFLVTCPVSPTLSPTTEAPLPQPSLSPTSSPPTTLKPITLSPTTLRPTTTRPTTASPVLEDTPQSTAQAVLDWIDRHLNDQRQQQQQQQQDDKEQQPPRPQEGVKKDPLPQRSNSTIPLFHSFTSEGASYPSYWFQYPDFFHALQIMSPYRSSSSITGKQRHFFYLGEKRAEMEYGLINVAAFLSMAMTESIAKDTCDEYSWEKNTDPLYSRGAAGEGKASSTPRDKHYAISNSCGQGRNNYQEFHCTDPKERKMECPVMREMVVEAVSGNLSPDAPPPLGCHPRLPGDASTGYWDAKLGKEVGDVSYRNSFGRTDVEGCCFWGRGAILTKGICNLGKLNYYLGKKAADDGRRSRYPTTDFCAYPEAICAGPDSREMRWVTSMFEWTERVQTYVGKEDGWSYMNQLKKFVDGGMFEFDFLHAVSSIVSLGCHSPPCEDDGDHDFAISDGASVNKTNIRTTFGIEIPSEKDRLKNFQDVLVALEARSEKSLVRAIIRFFSDQQDVMNSQVLQSKTPKGQLYPSYRYQLSDFLSALTRIAEGDIGGTKFYMGDSKVIEGVRYGIVNVVMFLAQAYIESIQYDSCDENNWELIDGQYPISNSCGQSGMSYQDMRCLQGEGIKACPVRSEMEQYALTSGLWFEAPAPLKCGPKSKFPITGYWNVELGEENNMEAYPNSRGRVDVEGCCWWGRGAIQTKGVCNYSKLNHFLGARAAREGRNALYPTIDFCEFPQKVCSSEETYSGELPWIVGLFEWADRIQSYDQDGWNYIEKLKEFTNGGYKDFTFVDEVSSILNLGCHSPPCAEIRSNLVEPRNRQSRSDTFQKFLIQLRVEQNFPAPTSFPTYSPTYGEEPTTSPTSMLSAPPTEVVDAFIVRVSKRKSKIIEILLNSKYPTGEYPSYIYTWKSFLDGLKKMTGGIGPGEGNWFYIGEKDNIKYGLVNLAAFMAHAITLGSISSDACDENNWEVVDSRYPLSNSCGQGGLSYQDQVCADDDISMECEVDTTMEIYGVTHAWWRGAPPTMFCANKDTGYWDHVTGFERNSKPFKNSAGRSDVRGCCWWGRGVLQIRGVCEYGRLNYYLGARAAAENRPSMYPNIDFCLNPGAICSDILSPELRWVSGMFYWAYNVQRNAGEVEYLGALKKYVQVGDYHDSSFIHTVNTILGGNNDDISMRTNVFYECLKVFGLMSDGKSDANAIIEGEESNNAIS